MPENEILPRRTLAQSISASGPQTYIDGYGVEREMYEPSIVKPLRQVYDKLHRLADKDYDLTDEQYFQKYGYYRPIEGAGILDLLNPAEAAKLAEIGETLKTAERAARVSKEAKSLEESNRTKQLINKADDFVTNPKTGRIHLINKPKQVAIHDPDHLGAELVMSVPKEKIVKSINPAEEARRETDIAFNNALSAYETSLSVGATNAAQQFLAHAQELARKLGIDVPYENAFKSALSK